MTIVPAQRMLQEGGMQAQVQFAASPNTLTILTTYQCTAACKQCCFQSSPRLTGRLGGKQIQHRINEATASFAGISLVVFSGGEAFLLKEDLYDAIAFSRSKDLLTRVVSNGSWGRSERNARKTSMRLQAAGLTELNISTGKDHQEWVSPQSVINSAKAAVDANIQTLITVEADAPDSPALLSITSNQAVTELLNAGLLTLQCNTWMPFHDSAEERPQAVDMDSLRSGCGQIFSNIVVTPNDTLSACCGLTLEHIPEMGLGSCDGQNMRALYGQQATDFLKYWIRVDGPYRIIERVLGREADTVLDQVVHACQACVILHKDRRVREALATKYRDFVPEVMTRFYLREGIAGRIDRYRPSTRKEQQ